MKRMNIRSISVMGVALMAAGWAFQSQAQTVAPVGAQTVPVPVQSAANVPPGPEYGRVISSTAVQTAVNVPKQVCGTEQVAVAQQKSGAGSAMGAIAGGAIGNQLGHGSGRAVATAVGIVGGVILGDRVEGTPVPQTQNVNRCMTQNTTEYRTTGYNVVYEYAGRQYSVQMPNDPGPWIKLQVTPAPVQQSQSPVSMSGIATSPTFVQTAVAEPAVVYAPAPVYVAASPVVVGTSFVYGRPYYAHPRMTVGVGFSYGYPRRWY
jgi:uncharacterized protein YcfJ